MIEKFVASAAVTTMRMSLALWVGGAALFVITSVAEQTNPEFGSIIRDQLATIRFPLYYVFGGILLATAIFTGGVAVTTTSGCLRKRITAALAFTILSAGCAAGDYFWVYRPLQQLITPPGQARSQEFVTLHERSRHANELHITLALVAAVLSVIPPRNVICSQQKSCDADTVDVAV